MLTLFSERDHPSHGARPRGGGLARFGLALALVAGLGNCGGGSSEEPAPPLAPTIVTQALPDGTLGIAYSVTLEAISGTPPLTWSVTSGSLPDGLKLNSSTGKIRGTPSTANTFAFTVRVADSLGQSVKLQFTVTIGTATPLVELISVDSTGVAGNGDSGNPAVSGDGRFVAFTSFANNLVPNDTNAVTDIFLRDRTCGVTVRVSVASDGSQAGSQSFAPSVSSLTGGTLFVAYVSDANNLVPNDTNNQRDIFVTAVDVSGCTLTPVSTARASVATDGTEGDGESNLPTISADGAFVAYHSNATNLVEADTNTGFDVFVTELQFTGGVLSAVHTRRHSTSKIRLAVLPLVVPDTLADSFSNSTIGSSTLAMVTDEHVGRRAEIVSGTGQGQARLIIANDATTLTVGANWVPLPDATSIFRVLSLDDTDKTADVFSANTIGSSTLALVTDEHVNSLVEIIAGTGQDQTRLISANDATTFTVTPDWAMPPDGTSVFRVLRQSGGNSFRGRISGDGAFVGFNTRGALDDEDTNFLDDAFTQERAAALTTRVSVDSAGTLSDGISAISGLSGNGSLVLFHSAATNLVASDTNAATDLFLHDSALPETLRVTLANDGSEADGNSDVVAGLSGGGRLAAFTSSATNLVADDRNQVRDVFLRDRLTPETRRLSLGMGGINPNDESFDAAISLDGTTVAFASAATNLVPNDTNSALDIFVATTAISDPPMIVVSQLPAPRKGVAYSAPLLAVGGTEPLFWTLEKGALPPGLFLDPLTGRISGLPQKDGHFQFTVLVIDADRPARRSSRTLTLVVGR